MESSEIGCTFGEFLIQLSRRFDLSSYGVEITSLALNLTEAYLNLIILTQSGNSGRFLSSDFQSKNQCAFDVVLSRGVIEHFTNVVEVIDKHINLLVPGGLLLVSIPHLRGSIIFWQECSTETLAIHNLEIMDKKFSPNFLSAKIFSLILRLLRHLFF